MYGTRKSELIDSITAYIEQEEFANVPVKLIERGKFQPRQEFPQESLAHLADSIRAQGVIEPVVLRRIDGMRYELIAGERRWRAAKLAGVEQIPAIIKNVPDEAAAAIALIENIQREELNPVELAQALEWRIEQLGSAQAVADELSVSKSWISQKRKILNAPEDVQSLAVEGLVTDKATLNKLEAMPEPKRKDTITKIRNGEVKSTEVSRKEKKAETVEKPTAVFKLRHRNDAVLIVERFGYGRVLDDQGVNWREVDDKGLQGYLVAALEHAVSVGGS